MNRFPVGVIKSQQDLIPSNVLWNSYLLRSLSPLWPSHGGPAVVLWLLLERNEFLQLQPTQLRWPGPHCSPSPPQERILPAHSSVPGSGVRGGVCGGVLLSPLHLNSYPSCSDVTLELSIRHARLLEIPSHVWISVKVSTLHVFTLMAGRGNGAISPTPLYLQPLLRPVCPFSGAQVAPLLPLKHFTHGYISNCCLAAQCCPTLLTPWTAACQSFTISWSCSYSWPLSRWYYLTISSSAATFSFCTQSFIVSGSFPMSQLFTSGGQSIGVSASASILPLHIQGWFPLGLTGVTSLLSKGFSSLL